MSSYLARRLSAARHYQFVGRTQELNLFQTAIAAAELPFYVLHLFGPGGVGKTTLLGEFIWICEQAEIPAIYLDGRNLEPAPESFLSALRFVMDLPPIASPLQVLGAQVGRRVILIDTYERLAPIDGWLREVFLPQIPESTLTILTGRHPPSVAWRADPGWQSLIRQLPLDNLSSAESRAYLSRRDVPGTQHQAVLDFTHGNPLALSLIVDGFAQEPDLCFQPEVVPDVIKALLERFIQNVPSSAHRIALEACSLVRLTTEALLGKMLASPDVHDLFTWLRQLSFIQPGRLGLFPHDLVREVLIADLRWRNPDWYAELHQRARNYYTTRLGQTQGQEQHRILFDYIFLHRDNPAVRPNFTWQENSSLVTDTLQETDLPALLRMVTEHEGEESAHLASYWIARQPQGVLVFRDSEQQLAGFVSMVALHQATPEDLATDPASHRAWDYLQNHAPLRPGEGATLFRFWMARDTYQAVSPTQSRIFISFVQQHQSKNTAGLAFTFYACAEPELWAAMFAYADLARIPEADFEVGRRHYGVYGHDWRAVSPKVWQELLARREIATSAQAIAPSQVSEPLLVLTQPEFENAVRQALRCFSRPSLLNHSPLLQSRLVRNRITTEAERGEQVAALQVLIREVAESLQASPREAKYYQALYHTYFHPAATQEQAAELLDLPFATFRRHLKTGVRQLIEHLWHQEIGREK